jgi:hypothetical protein
MLENENDEGEDFKLTGNEIFNLNSETVSAYVDCCSTQRTGAKYAVNGHRALATQSEPLDLHHPEIIPSGIFFEPDLVEIPTPKSLPGYSVGKNQEEFHDSENEDVFTLFNVCNGEMHDGLLDIRKLDELSTEELKFLDVARLKEIWLHTASGCSTCDGIIRTLNMVRGSFGNESISEEETNH